MGQLHMILALRQENLARSVDHQEAIWLVGPVVQPLRKDETFETLCTGVTRVDRLPNALECLVTYLVAPPALRRTLPRVELNQFPDDRQFSKSVAHLQHAPV